MMDYCFNLDSGAEAGNCSEGSLRLTGGSALVGRLEICINNAWGTICETQFESSELNVACSQLGGTGTALGQLSCFSSLYGYLAEFWGVGSSRKGCCL